MSGFETTRRQALGLSLGGMAALALPGWARAAVLGEADIDAIVRPFMQAYDTPGIAVAVVRPGQPAFVKGYGVRTLGKSAPVDIHTRFGIASHSKAFTAAALALLVDAGRLDWEDPVIKHLPEFRMHDPAVTRMMTVRDLLVHRSGLPLGAGDLMYFPQSSHVAADVLKALPFLKPVRGFRTGYDYDNILYLVAGVLIERLSGMTWDRFVEQRLFAPLGMTDAVGSRGALRTDNVAGRHARLGPPVRGIGRLEVVQADEGPAIDAAGGINASISDMAKWLQVQLDQGKLPNGKQLWSLTQAKEMWTPATITSSSSGPTPDNPVRPILQTYALGWFVQDYRGLQMIQHSGGLSGQVTYSALLPSRGIAVSVFSNVEESVSSAIRNAILDRLIDAPAFDWVAAYGARSRAQQQEALASVEGGIDKAPAGGPSLPLASYVGRYRDPWYGDIVVADKSGKLTIDFTPTPVFKSVLEPWGPDTFRTRFAKDAGEDAIVTFAVHGGKVTGVTMKALSPLADFSFDYQHLAFVPVS
ncbi:serine hydrolase [Sphingomonas psychrotolerans]|uniref:Serine hydrolase n=1 Tax=Sphingomonas psychrotolerans TaxID=1327635 RepID=A0ABU3N1R8_9SPHN|nr:serine hydrolase [Sphingomonas psychrotolerans]MDT8758489.1 serine hydrolase [Sphingomonas psychrotolerans]